MKTYSFTTYNIFKCHLPFSRQNIGKLASINDFLAIQEWVSSLHTRDDEYISSCTTFKVPFRNVETGTAMISHYEPTEVKTFLSKQHELGFATKKSMIMTSYMVHEQPLTIMNCHALNFVPNILWRESIDAWLAHIPKDGALIVAGDFNTWNSWRLEYLKEKLQERLCEYAHDNHYLPMKLDHIWYRDIHMHECKADTNMHTSDHYPITLQFSFK